MRNKRLNQSTVSMAKQRGEGEGGKYSSPFLKLRNSSTSLAEAGPQRSPMGGHYHDQMGSEEGSPRSGRAGSKGSKGSALGRLRLLQQVSRGDLDEEALLSPYEIEMAKRLREKNKTQDERQDDEIQAILRKYTYDALPDGERKMKEHQDKISELRLKYEELKWSRIHEKAMFQYDKFMRVQGIGKKHQAKSPENAVQQRQEIRLLLRQNREKTQLGAQHSVSNFSSDSRVSLQDKVNLNKSFLSKHVKSIVVDDRKERMK